MPDKQHCGLGSAAPGGTDLEPRQAPSATSGEMKLPTDKEYFPPTGWERHGGLQHPTQPRQPPEPELEMVYDDDRPCRTNTVVRIMRQAVAEGDWATITAMIQAEAVNRHSLPITAELAERWRAQTLEAAQAYRDGYLAIKQSACPFNNEALFLRLHNETMECVDKFGEGNIMCYGDALGTAVRCMLDRLRR